MLKKLQEIHEYVVTDWNTSGWKIRMVARTHMVSPIQHFHHLATDVDSITYFVQLNAIICELLYTYWMFSLPRGWDPSMPAAGPFEGFGRECKSYH